MLKAPQFFLFLAGIVLATAAYTSEIGEENAKAKFGAINAVVGETEANRLYHKQSYDYPPGGDAAAPTPYPYAYGSAHQGNYFNGPANPIAAGSREYSAPSRPYPEPKITEDSPQVSGAGLFDVRRTSHSKGVTGNSVAETLNGYGNQRTHSAPIPNYKTGYVAPAGPMPPPPPPPYPLGGYHHHQGPPQYPYGYPPPTVPPPMPAYGSAQYGLPYTQGQIQPHEHDHTYHRPQPYPHEHHPEGHHHHGHHSSHGYEGPHGYSVLDHTLKETKKYREDGHYEGPHQGAYGPRPGDGYNGAFNRGWVR